MSSRSPPTQPRSRPSREGPLRRWCRLALLLVVVLSVGVTSVTATASGGAHATPGAAVSSPSQSFAAASVAQQTTATANNSTVRHRNPETVETESGADELQEVLRSRLEARLAESASRIDRGQYEEAQELLGEAYLEQLEQYAEVADARGDGDAAAVVERYNETRTSQQEYSQTAEEFEATYDAYQRAVARGDDQRARELARELERLGDEADQQSGGLSRNYTELGGRTGADLTTVQGEVRATQTGIDERRSRVTAAEFETTRLRILQADERGSFTDPLAIRGRLESEGEPVSQRSVRIRIGSQTNVVRTDADGDFVVGYRPTAVPANASTVTVQYVPEDRSPYLSSNASIPVSVTATRATVTLERSTDTARFGDAVTVEGRVQVDETPVQGLPLAVVAGDVQLGTVRTDSDGRFSITQPLPASVTPGARQLSVSAAGAGRAVRVPAESVPLAVRETPATLAVAATSGQAGIRVIGNLIASERPVQARRIAVSVGGDRVGTARTGSDGSFALELDAEDAGGTATVSFDGAGTNLRSAETTVEVPALTTASPSTEAATPGSAAEPTVGVGALLSGAVPLTVTNVATALTTPVGLVAGSAAVGLGGLALALLVRRRRAETRVAGASTPVTATGADAGGGGRAAPTAGETATVSEELLAAAAAAADAGATNEAVIAAYGAVRAALDERLPATRTLTHRQFLDVALAAGVDEDALRTLTGVYEAAQYEDATVPEPASRTALATARQFVEAPADTPVEARTDGGSAD